MKKGDYIKGFVAANEAIGTLILNFNEQSEMENKMNRIDEFMKVVIYGE